MWGKDLKVPEIASPEEDADFIYEKEEVCFTIKSLVLNHL